MAYKSLQNVTKKLISIVLIMIMMLGFINAIIITKTYAINQERNNELENIDKINEEQYPGYKSALKSLKEAHPNWRFTLLYTDLDWKDVLINETVARHGRSLVQGKSGEWLCTDIDCAGKSYDGANWYCASQTAVAYYMDPRNFLTESKVFQFESLSYVPVIQTETGVEAVLKGTFMSNKKISDYYGNTDYGTKTFAQAIIAAAEESKVSPYHIAARIKQEVGVNGSGSTSGKVSGYEGYFNFYNIGAYAGADAVVNGLIYAKSVGWDNPETAIIQGAKSIATSYIGKGQDSIYLEKWDVDNQYTGIYSHQYMQNIQAAASEAYSVYNTYCAIFNYDLSNTSFNFIIPLYKNMPKTLSRYPSTSTYVAQDVQIRDTSGVGVNVRKEPTIYSDLINTYYRGDTLLRIELNVNSADGYNWDKVMLSDGTMGYIATQFLTEDTSVNLLSKKAYVNKETELINGPRITSNDTTAFRILYEGQSVTILEEGKYNFDNINWIRIKLGDGAIGYVSKENITEGTYGEEVEITCDTELALRSTPYGNITTYIEPGIIVNRIENATSKISGYYWDKVITADGIIGYMARERYNPDVLWLTPVDNTQTNEEQDKPNDNPDTKMAVDETKKEITTIPGLTFDDLKKEYTNITIISGTETLGTGTKIKIDENEYTIIKMGDANGDGIANAIDLLLIKRKMLGTYTETEFSKIALDLNKDENINAIDLLLQKRHLLGTQFINI